VPVALLVIVCPEPLPAVTEATPAFSVPLVTVVPSG